MGEIASETDSCPTEGAHNTNSSSTLGDSTEEPENARNDTSQAQAGQKTDTSTGVIQVICRSRLSEGTDTEDENEKVVGGAPSEITGVESTKIPDDLLFIMGAWPRLSVEAKAAILARVRAEIE